MNARATVAPRTLVSCSPVSASRFSRTSHCARSRSHIRACSAPSTSAARSSALTRSACFRTARTDFSNAPFSSYGTTPMDCSAARRARASDSSSSRMMMSASWHASRSRSRRRLAAPGPTTPPFSLSAFSSLRSSSLSSSPPHALAAFASAAARSAWSESSSKVFCSCDTGRSTSALCGLSFESCLTMSLISTRSPCSFCSCFSAPSCSRRRPSSNARL